MAEIKNLRKAAKRVLEAVRDKEKIILYGDSDPDGAISVVVLKETLDILGQKNNKIKIYFPNREKEGYGLNESALKFLEKESPALLIVLDCGIGNIKEVEIAKKMGFEVIIIDHHEILPQLPKALIIDPKQKDDKYPFKYFACAGIVYKFSRLLLSLASKTYSPEKFLELVSLATLADKMPLSDENMKLVNEGILALNMTQRPALKILTEGFTLGIDGVNRKIIPVLNTGETFNHLNELYTLFTEKSLKKSKELIKKLIHKRERKKEKIKEIYKEIEERLISKIEQDFVIFEGGSSWPLVLAGPVASMICQKYKKPTFIFRRGEEKSAGAVRVSKDLNGVKAMESCQELLETYGGHPLAGGFRVKNKNLKRFKECLIDYFKQNIKIN